jgi:adenosylcobinamide-GDP ribazoletransferase
LAALAVEALITGAFHEDALADFFDAFGGGWTREKRLEILKDSRLGTFGAAGLLFGLALRAGAIVATPAPYRYAAVVASCTFGRFFIIWVSRLVDPVPERASLAKEVGHRTGNRELVCGGLLCIPGGIAWIALSPARAAVALIVSAAVTAWFAGYVKRRIDGLTGDCMGAICYICQVIVLLVSAAGNRPGGWA